MGEKERSVSSEEEVEQQKVSCEYLFEFNEGEVNGEWIRLSNEQGKTLEGAHFIPPENANGEVVVFHPGLPGDGVVWFEEKDVQAFLEEGYEVFVARHGGLIFTEANEKYVHNKKRMEIADAVPANPVTVHDWLEEPEISLEFFSGKPTTLITHSFGALAGGYSLAELQEKYGDAPDNPLNNLKKWLILGGVTHDLKGDGVIDKSKGKTLKTWKNRFAQLSSEDIYNLEESSAAAKGFENGLKTFNENISSLPKNIDVISVNPEGDSYVGIEASLDLQKHLKRGLVIDDQTLDSELFLGAEPHDFPHMKPETMLRLVKMKTSESPHVAKVSKKT